jgi:hypothetical protein
MVKIDERLPTVRVWVHKGLDVKVNVEKDKQYDENIKLIDALWYEHPEINRRKELEMERLKLKKLVKDCRCEDMLLVLDHSMRSAYYLRNKVFNSDHKDRETMKIDLDGVLTDVVDEISNFDDSCTCKQKGTKKSIEPPPESFDTPKIKIPVSKEDQELYGTSIKKIETSEFKLKEHLDKYNKLLNKLERECSSAWFKDRKVLDEMILALSVLDEPLAGCDCSQTARNVCWANSLSKLTGDFLQLSPLLTYTEKKEMCDDLQHLEGEYMLKLQDFNTLCKCQPKE